MFDQKNMQQNDEIIKLKSDLILVETQLALLKEVEDEKKKKKKSENHHNKQKKKTKKTKKT